MPEPTGIVKRVTYLNLAIERGTANVPDDGRYWVTREGAAQSGHKTLTIAEAYLDLLVDEIHEEDPSLKRPGELLRAEQAFHDILSARGESRAAARAKAQQKGGKGGRGGV